MGALLPTALFARSDFAWPPQQPECSFGTVIQIKNGMANTTVATTAAVLPCRRTGSVFNAQTKSPPHSGHRPETFPIMQ